MAATNPKSKAAQESFAKSKAKLEAETKASKDAFAKSKEKLEAEKKQPDSGVAAAAALSALEFSAAKTEIKRIEALQQQHDPSKASRMNEMMNVSQSLIKAATGKIGI